MDTEKKIFYQKEIHLNQHRKQQQPLVLCLVVQHQLNRV